MKILGFFGKLLSFYYNDVIINFDPVSVPWKGEREQRLRICKITSPKGKRKKCKKKLSETGRKDHLKNKKQEQEIKTILNKDHVQGFQIKINTEKRDKFRLV